MIKTMVQGNEFEFEIMAKPTFSYIRVYLKAG